MKKIKIFILMFITIITFSSLEIMAQTSEITRSGNTWTARVNGNTVYTGNRMFDAINSACDNMGAGTVNIRNSGESGPGGSNIYAIFPQNNQTLDFHGNTIDCNGNDLVVAIRADRKNNITVRNVNVTGRPRYGFWFTGCNNVTFTDITMNISTGLGIRYSGRDGYAGNLTINGNINIRSAGHSIETYTVENVNIGTVTVRSQNGCGVLLNDSWEVSIDSIFAYDCNFGGSYAGLRLANRNRKTRVKYLYARGCGRGFYSVSDSHDCIIEEVNLANNSTSGASVSNSSHHIYINSGTITNSNVNLDIWRDARNTCIRVNGQVYGDDCGACIPNSITGYVRVNQGNWQESNSAELEVGGIVEFGPHPATGGSWSWSGPSNFNANTREVTISNIQSNQAGTYTATHTNNCGAESTQNFAVTVNTPVVTEIEIGSGSLIENLTVFEVENGENWSIVDNIEVGQTIFGDREFTIASIPNFGGSIEWIQTAMNSRTNTSLDNYATFTAKETGFVYIAHSSRVEEKPAWLSDYELTDLVITVQESADVARTLNLYRKSVFAGETVNVGINSNDGITNSYMYIVIITNSTTSVKQVANIEKVDLSVFPNPFNPIANIKFTVANSSDVELNVFNINGELVSSLASGVFEKGHYTASFNGKNLSSGVYFVRFSSENTNLQKKMILLK